MRRQNCPSDASGEEWVFATSHLTLMRFVDQGYAVDQPAAHAETTSIRLELVKLPAATHGFMLLPRRWVVERSLARMTRFRQLVRDCERVAETLTGLHVVAFAMLMAHRFVTLMARKA